MKRSSEQGGPPGALGRFAPLAWLALLFLAVESALRVALLVREWPRLDAGPLLAGRILALGLLHDLVPALAAAAPLALALAAIPSRLHRSRVGRALVHALFVAAAALAGFTAIAEWLFWDEFGARFNFIAVDYLVYTREVLGNIWESYPVGRLLAVLAALALAAWWPLRHRLATSCRAPSPLGRRLAAASLLGCVAVVSVVGADDGWVPAGREAGELAKSGPFELFSALRNNALDYEPFYASEGEKSALRRAHRLLDAPGTRFVSDDPTELERETQPTRPERRLNVVLIVVESLSAQFLGAWGSPFHLTPNLDALAQRSLLFSRLYATGNRTVRGLEAVSLSIPPTPGASIVRRPGNDHLVTIGSPFRDRGYDVRFVYGGYALFDNMRPFFEGNGFDVVDRGDFASDEVHFANAWGMADEDLFRRVVREGDASHAAGRPFFSLVLTTSNHRPYTYPDGRVSIPSGSGRHGAVEYTDWAIGELLRQAASRPWFDDTVFAIVADHCHSSAGRTEVPVRKYHIPLLVFSPKHVEPGRVDTLASQIDVAPTLLGLLGFSYRSRFFGRDLLGAGEVEPRALLGTYQRLALLESDMLTILSPRRRIDAYRVDLARGREVEAAPEPALVADAIAYYESASFAWRKGLLREDEGAAGAAASR